MGKSVGLAVGSITMLLLSGLVLMGCVPQAARAEGVFLPLTGADKHRFAERDAAVLLKEKTLLRAGHAKLNGGALFRETILPALAGKATSAEFNLFDDGLRLTVVTERVRELSSESYEWVGHLNGDPETRAVFVVKKGDDPSGWNLTLVGTIRAQGKVYYIEPDEQGAHAVLEYDPRKFPPERPPLAPPMPPPVSAPGPLLPAVPGESRPKLIPTSHSPNPPLPLGNCRIDVMVLYTSAARGTRTHAQMRDAIEQVIRDTNDTYNRSDIVQRLHLVHAGEVSYAEVGGDLSTDLDNLINGPMPDLSGIDVATLRNLYHADLVSLWIRDCAGSCLYSGFGRLMGYIDPAFESWAFSVVRRDSAIVVFSFAHELGHNMGARHDRAYEGIGNNLRYDYGYVSQSRQWRTIMAENNACEPGYCERLGFWSNPDRIHLGEQTGIATPNPPALSNAADNHRRLNDTAFTVAGFRSPGVTTTACQPGNIVDLPPRAPENLRVQ